MKKCERKKEGTDFFNGMGHGLLKETDSAYKTSIG